MYEEDQSFRILFALGILSFFGFFPHLHLIHIPVFASVFPEPQTTREAGCNYLVLNDECLHRREERRQAHLLLSLSRSCSPLLTVLAVVGDLHLALLGAVHCLRHLADGLAVGQVAVEEVAGARLLHDVWPGEARHLAEAVVAVDDCTVLHPGVGDHKLPICVVIGDGRTS